MIPSIHASSGMAERTAAAIISLTHQIGFSLLVTPAKEAVRKLVQIPNRRSGTGRRAGPGTYEHQLCQCVRRPVFMVSGLPGWRPCSGMTSFFRFRDSLESGNSGTSVTCPEARFRRGGGDELRA